MRFRTATSLLLACLTLGIMGATPKEPAPSPSVLEELPILRSEAVDPGALEAATFDSLGIPRRWTLAKLVSLVEGWRDTGGRAACGHPESHELVSTVCSLSPGGSLDRLYLRVLEGWWRGRLLEAGEITLLYGGLPEFLASTHQLEDGVLRVGTMEIMPEELVAERARLKHLGVSGADLWSNLDVARSLRRRRAEEVDLRELAKERNPEGIDLRRQVLERLVRPLALYLGDTGGVGDSVRAYLEDQRAEPVKLGPLLAPDAIAVVAPTIPVTPESLPSPVASAPTDPVPEAPIQIRTPPTQTPEAARVTPTGFAVAFGGTRFAGRR